MPAHLARLFCLNPLHGVSDPFCALQAAVPGESLGRAFMASTGFDNPGWWRAASVGVLVAFIVGLNLVAILAFKYLDGAPGAPCCAPLVLLHLSCNPREGLFEPTPWKLPATPVVIISLSYYIVLSLSYRYHIVIILLLYRYHMLLVVRTQQKTTQKFITTHTAEPSQRKAVIPPERLEQQEADGDVSASRSRTSTKQACAAMPHMQLTALLWTACTRFAGSTRKHSWFT